MHRIFPSSGPWFSLLLSLMTTCLASVAACREVENPGAENGAVESACAERLPNIVFIMADDLGQGDLGCYNAKSKIPTPAMDRLAAQGMRFTDAHTPSSVCTPTRYGVLTGRYCWRSKLKSGVLGGYSPALLEPGRMTVASMLRDHGYHTACVGKWHLGLGSDKKTDYTQPLAPGGREAGFDFFHVIPASLDMAPYLWVRGDRATEQPTAKTSHSARRWSGGKGFWRGGPMAPGFAHDQVLPITAEEAVAYVDRRVETNRDQPFFLYVPFSAPHTPWLPTKPFEGKTSVGPYGDFTHQVDSSVGQIVAAIERNKLADETLVIVTSDNGSHWPDNMIEKYDHDANNHRRGQKADIYEGGHRVPFIARWPGKIEPGTVSDQVICLTDLAATAAEIVGHALPATAAEDSFSLLSVLQGEASKPIRKATIHHSLAGMFAIRQGDWKLITGLGSGGFTAPRAVKPTEGGPRGQLYNLANDPREQHDLYAARPDVVHRLETLLTKYRQSGQRLVDCE